MDLSGTTSSSSILRFNTFANARLKKKAGYNRFATERFWCDLRLLLFSNAVTALFLCPLATYTVVHSRGTERSVTLSGRPYCLFYHTQSSSRSPTHSRHSHRYRWRSWRTRRTVTEQLMRSWNSPTPPRRYSLTRKPTTRAPRAGASTPGSKQPKQQRSQTQCPCLPPYRRDAGGEQ